MTRSYNLSIQFTGKAVITDEDMKFVDELQAKVNNGEHDDTPHIARLKGLNTEDFIVAVLTGNLRREFRKELIYLLQQGGITKVSPLQVTIEPKEKTNGEGQAA